MLSETEILSELDALYARRGVEVELGLDVELRDIGFRSLDLSEVALRLESKLGRELVFSGESLRQVVTVRDLVAFFAEASTAG